MDDNINAVQLEMQDCYHKAEPGEAKFTLLARDPIAATMVRLWAASRECNVTEMVRQFVELFEIANERYVGNPTDDTQLSNACAIAGDMEQWRAVNRN